MNYLAKKVLIDKQICQSIFIKTNTDSVNDNVGIDDDDEDDDDVVVDDDDDDYISFAVM